MINAFARVDTFENPWKFVRVVPRDEDIDRPPDGTREIDAAVLTGRTLEEIDTEILGPCALSEDARSALWLYAWGAVGRAASSGVTAIGDPADPVIAPVTS